MAETNGRLEVAFRADTVGTCTSAPVSTCRLRGDFDMRVDYRLLAWPPLNGIRVGLGADLPNPPAVERTSREGQEVYLTHFDDGILGLTPTDASRGTLRLIRTGKTVTGYYRSGDDWAPVHAGPVTDADVRFHVAAWSQGGEFTGHPVKVAFANFVLDQGELVCPIAAAASRPRGERRRRRGLPGPGGRKRRGT